MGCWIFFLLALTSSSFHRGDFLQQFGFLPLAPILLVLGGVEDVQAQLGEACILWLKIMALHSVYSVHSVVKNNGSSFRVFRAFCG